MKDLIKYIEYGIDIKRNADATYSVFTIPTQHFNINSLDELTPERFEKAISHQNKREELQLAIMEMAFGNFNKEQIDDARQFVDGKSISGSNLCVCTVDRQTPEINGKPVCAICNRHLYPK